MAPFRRLALFSSSRKFSAHHSLADKRKNHVPRYLFRAWSSVSGGGCATTVNSTTEIIPPAFVQGSGHKFYEMKESEIKTMAQCHYNGSHTPLSEFSSWAASLTLALCYAQVKVRRGEKDVHVAMIDTLDLDPENEVLVWHVPQLLDNPMGNHEYLAHGRIRGRGYKAVRLDELQKKGVDKVFSELSKTRDSDQFGYKVRSTLFGCCTLGKMPSERDLKQIKVVADLFDHMWLPVAVGLINIRPRPWWRPDNGTGDVSQEDLETIYRGLGEPIIPPEWSNEGWLGRKDMVNTDGFADVRQWIDLMRALAQYASTGHVEVPVKVEAYIQPGVQPVQVTLPRYRRRRRIWCFC